MRQLPAIIVTEEDYNRLNALLDAAVEFNDTLESLEEELSRATLVKRAELPSNVVTMNSVVRFLNETTQQEHEMRLVYPNEVQGGDRRISVLAPAGAALLGLSVGDVIDWPRPGQAPLSIKILDVDNRIDS